MKPWALVFSLFFFLVPGLAFSESPQTDKARMEKLVLEIIRENPEVVYQAYEAEKKRQAEKKKQEALEKSFRVRVEDRVPASAPSKGPKDAPITLINYLDYQCGYCARGARTLDQLMTQYPGKIRVVIKDNPLGFHKQGIPAARAAAAAQSQGKYWEYQALLFKNSSKLNDAIYEKLARDLNLDLERFNRDRALPETEARVRADMEDFSKLRLKGTPHFIVNGVKVRGAKSLSHFQGIIDRLLKEEDKTPPK